MAYNVENIKTDNIPLLDELIFNLKKLLYDSVMKDEEAALNNETLESQKESDVYISCLQDRANLNMFDYKMQELINLGIPDYLINDILLDPSNTPDSFKKPLLKFKTQQFIDNYVEKNNYYRMLNGIPDIGDSGIKIPEEYLDIQLRGIIDTNIYVHQMRDTEIDVLYTFNIINRLIQENPTKKYLEHMGSKSIPIIDARTSKKFELLYTTIDCPREVLVRFREKFEQNRIYTLKVLYSDAFKFGSDYYDNFMQVLILIETAKDMLAELPDFIIKKDIFDFRMIELIFQSNGIDFFPEIPFRYQIAMVRNLNRLIKFKSTTKNIIDICSLFGFENIQVFKYYLLRDRKYDKFGNYEFNFKEIVNDDSGEIEIVEDVAENYDLKFLKVPIQDKADDYLYDRSKYLDYDEIALGDKYWNGDLDHNDVKRAILEDEFNYLQSKYISIDTIYSMTELSFQLCYFYNILFDEYKLEDKLFVRVPTINGLAKFKLVDLISYLYSLMYEYNGVVDDLMDTPTKILYIKGFNFSVDMTALAAYVQEQGFTMEELGVGGFIIPETGLLSYEQLIHVYTNNKNIHDHIVKQLYKADNKKIYDIYKKIYDSLMIMELSMKFFTLKDGTIAKTYTQFLKERDVILYQSLITVRATDNNRVKQQKITELIDAVIYAIEEYLDDEQFKFIFSFLPSASSEAVKRYIYKVVNFFKSYKVDILSINTIYKFDDKLENKINIIDDIFIKYFYTKHETIDAISKLRNNVNLTKKDMQKIIEKIYFETTFWMDLFNSDNITTKDIMNLLSTLNPKSYVDIGETISTIVTKRLEKESLNINDKISITPFTEI